MATYVPLCSYEFTKVVPFMAPFSQHADSRMKQEKFIRYIYLLLALPHVSYLVGTPSEAECELLPLQPELAK